MAATTLVDRALIRLSGEDVRGFLQGLVTNDLNQLAEDRPLWAGLLTPQGKALFDFILWDAKGLDGGEDVLVDCEREAAGDLARRLTLYRLRRKIEIRREEVLCVHWAPPSSAPAETGAQTTSETGPRLSPGNSLDPRLSDLGHRWLAPEDGAGGHGWLAHRLSLGVAEGLAELGSDKILWLEANAAELNGVSFTKGCYVGQENTARMHHRSKVNRRLVVVRTDSPGERTRIHYPELGLAVEHRRIEDLGDAIVPEWLASVVGS